VKKKIAGNFGELEIQFGKIKGRGAKITRELLTKLLHRIVVRSTGYYDEAASIIRNPCDRDHVFAYRERQFHSVVCPAIADLTPYFLIENPLSRKPAGKEEYSGSVDYWLYYKDYSYMIELKHAYFAYTRADNPRTNAIERFSEALQQLRNIRMEECRSLRFGKGLRKIALEAVVFYRDSKQKSTLEADMRNKNFRKLYRKLLRVPEFAHNSNLNALWVLKKRLVSPIEYSNALEVYPAVAFIGSILDVVK
jgi:hypothetical protein